ncbi:E3 ubiquitin-protein ligase PUB23-like [Diospyros lotus]|uniref:E3 ubiquitin-protein ligase PUB23-like n=1 Tax=Diospyros lotus TaxID=55363 RepID=UPI00225A0C86|nr:E3 ubiquitin-protein ligase PUB23-like [Diospyros lotus]
MEKKANLAAMDVIPPEFRCPISMEPMRDPVTISTGVTYERKSIEKWFFTYKNITCPATMQRVKNFDITPNHTLKRLILSWQNGLSQSSSSSSPSSVKYDELISLINTIESTPFTVSSLKKLRSIVEMGDDTKAETKLFGGVEMLVRIFVQILDHESLDFLTFRACEEALGILHELSESSDQEDIDKTLIQLSKPATVESMSIMLHRGSAEARFCAISMLRQMAKRGHINWNFVMQAQGTDNFFKSMLEIVSDGICSQAGSCALEILREVTSLSKKSRVKAIEAGAVCVLIELLPDANRSKCEKTLHLIRLLCECADGRSAFLEHGLGIAAITQKMMSVSDVSTSIAVKILWLVCRFHPTERVVEEMLIFGAVKKLVGLLDMDFGRWSSKEKVANILKLHGNSWRNYPCSPSGLMDYVGN